MRFPNKITIIFRPDKEGEDPSRSWASGVNQTARNTIVQSDFGLHRVLGSGTSSSTHKKREPFDSLFQPRIG
jgi:hypothetical protein